MWTALLTLALLLQSAAGFHSASAEEMAGGKVRIVICTTEGLKTLVLDPKTGTTEEVPVSEPAQNCHYCVVAVEAGAPVPGDFSVTVSFHVVTYSQSKDMELDPVWLNQSKPIRAPPAFV